MKHEDEVRATFERFSADYDARFPRLIPRYAEFHGVTVQRMAEHLRRRAASTTGGRPLVVDLGCGTGELSRRLLEAVPDVRVHGIDLAPAMVERAREKLTRRGREVTFAVGNILEADLPPEAAGVISALAVHHLEGLEKAALFRRLFASLAPDGLFVLGDAVDGESSRATRYYEARWVDHMREAGLDESEIGSVLADHERNDRFSTLTEHLAWLRAAGFREVECLWKYYFLVVLAAAKS